MRKTLPVSHRIEPALKAALQKAAKDDRRTLSSLIEKILTDWAKARRLIQDRKP